MLERLFHHPDVRQRLRAHPLAPLLREYAAYLQAQGYHCATMRDYVGAVEHFASWLHAQGFGVPDLNSERVSAFLREHLGQCHCPAHAPKTLDKVRPALNQLLRHLREQGHQEAAQPPTPLDVAVAQFRFYLRDACGLAEGTCSGRARFAREFLQGKFGSGPLSWEDLRPGDVIAFVTAYARRCRPSTAQGAATTLRSLLRYLQSQGWCAPSLVAAVPRLPHWKLADISRTLTDDQLRALLATFDRARSTGRRDYAMARCMTDLGLRVSEVVALRLEDIDWHAATVRIAPGKSRRTRELPLPERLGRAIARYLRRGRPGTSCRQVFVRHRFRRGAAVSTALIRGVVRRALAQVPGCEQLTGTHILRHTAATRLHRAGTGLKGVADILGHSCLGTTTIYTKVDLPALAAVALPWPEELP
jgi:site-specific recombinase XerD